MGKVKSAEPRHYAKFYRNRSNRGRDTEIFGFFQMAAAVILNFKIFKFFTVRQAKQVEPLHCAKSRQNRSNPGRCMVIFSKRERITLRLLYAVAIPCVVCRLSVV